MPESIVTTITGFFLAINVGNLELDGEIYNLVLYFSTRGKELSGIYCKSDERDYFNITFFSIFLKITRI